MRRRGPFVVLGVVGFIALGAVVRGGGKFDSADAIRARFPDPDAAAASADYIGSAECEDCHEDRGKSLRASFHASLAPGEAGAGRACQQCHGPGRAHADEAGDGPIRNPGKVPAREIDGACLRCHLPVLAAPVRGHREWVAGPAGEVRSCVQCHRIHVDRAAKEFDDALGPFVKVEDLAKVAVHVPGARCIECHPGFHPRMDRSGHRDLRGGDAACGTCHGPGSLHAASGGDPKKIVHPGRQSPPAVADSCNRCHGSTAALARWTCSEHAKEGTSCVVCHDANGPEGKTLRGSEFALCGSCHLDVKARFLLPNRHRVAEGRMGCTNCHDPHGNTGKVRDKDLRTRACLECHGEKGGPFLYDHGIKRTEGCVACHDPHGGPNRRMLAYPDTRSLCLSCHAETFHDLGDAKYRNCLSCHIEIHGSDLDRRFLR
ncbi:MAG: cytochrome c3 family protein [Planctomycetes bacterium]|jgi:DmsE family decaheme c-type cytochrome|nr:cytochrome c3 family protein [Planctomycetota bacterium]